MHCRTSGVLTMFTIGVDVGGTYTDLVAIDETGQDRVRQIAVDAGGSVDRRDGGAGRTGAAAEADARGNAGRDRPRSFTARRLRPTRCWSARAPRSRCSPPKAIATSSKCAKASRATATICARRRRSRWCRASCRFGVKERLKANGEVAIPLDDASLDEAIAAIKKSGATSVAVCFLHSYLNPVHEIAAVERLTRELPDISVSRSSDVLPQIKEYERVSTTIVNAYVGPLVRRYLTNLEQRLTEAGFKGSLFVMLSHGGMAPVEEASRLAAGTVLSGPAGGISGGRRCADLLGIPDLVPFDMGGTSTDISLISDGQASLSADGMLAGQRIALRSLDIASIAAGGGSIASVDAGGTLAGRTGKRGLGAGAGLLRQWRRRPRPSPTPMSCSAISMPRAFMGGQRPLDRAASEAAVDRVAASLELSRQEAAAGIYRMINLKMADGIRLMTLRRGVDPRRFALLSFGGAAGAARGRGRARTGDQAHHRADGGLGAVGVGHADQRSALRSEPHALWRGPAHFGRTKCASCSPSWSSRPPAGCAPGSMGRSRSSDPPRCATASRCSRSTSRSMVSTGTRPTWSTRSRIAFIAATRNSTPTPRATRRWCSSTPASPRSARSRKSSRHAKPRRRRRGRARRAATRQAFFGGWREVPVYALDDAAARACLGGPGDHRGRDHDGAGR